jgi:hypothetical protein
MSKRTAQAIARALDLPVPLVQRAVAALQNLELGERDGHTTEPGNVINLADHRDRRNAAAIRRRS